MKEISAILVRNKSGDYFVHQRATTKRLFPGLFGLGAGGHVELGETALEAAARELQEETGISVSPDFLFTFDYANDTVVQRLHVFEAWTEEAPTITHQEWQWFGWCSEDQIEDLALQGKLCPDTLLFYRRYRERERRLPQNL